MEWKNLKTDDIDYLKNEIEDSFKKKADSLIDGLGMSHMEE
jgi:hypothetical protein